MNLETFVANGQAAQADVDRMTQHVNPTPLLCQAAVRKFLLENAANTRAHKFTRISEETLIAANEAVRQFLVGHVKRMPSRGRTL